MLCEKPLAASAEAAPGSSRRRRRWGAGWCRSGSCAATTPLPGAQARLDDGEIGVPLLAHMAHRNAGRAAAPSTSAMLDHRLGRARDRRDPLAAGRGDPARHRVRAARLEPHQAGAAGSPAPPVRDRVRPRWSTSSASSARAMATTSAARSWGRRGRSKLAPPARVTARARTARGVAVDPGFWTRFAPAYQDELQDWVNAVSRGEPTGPTAWDGYAAAAVSEAAVVSLREGGASTCS